LRRGSSVTSILKGKERIQLTFPFSSCILPGSTTSTSTHQLPRNATVSRPTDPLDPSLLTALKGESPSTLTQGKEGEQLELTRRVFLPFLSFLPQCSMLLRQPIQPSRIHSSNRREASYHRRGLRSRLPREGFREHQGDLPGYPLGGREEASSCESFRASRQKLEHLLKYLPQLSVYQVIEVYEVEGSREMRMVVGFKQGSTHHYFSSLSDLYHFYGLL